MAKKSSKDPGADPKKEYVYSYFTGRRFEWDAARRMHTVDGLQLDAWFDAVRSETARIMSRHMADRHTAREDMIAQNVGENMSYHNPHFVRWWLDQWAITALARTWVAVFDAVRCSGKHDKEADKVASAAESELAEVFK